MEKIFKHNKNFLRLKQMLIRYISCISIFALTLIFTPNFEISSFYVFLLSSFCIIILDYMVGILTGVHDEPIGRSIVGFFSFSLIIYITNFIVAGYSITIVSSLIAAGIYSLIDFLLPNSPGSL